MDKITVNIRDDLPITLQWARRPVEGRTQKGRTWKSSSRGMWVVGESCARQAMVGGS